MALDSRITIQKLEIFKLVVDLGSVTQAADQLVVGQPVVSAHIRSLERRVGAQLFYREGRRLHLTEAGQAVLAWAEDVLTRTRELGRHLDGLSDGTRGTVVLSASMSIGSYTLPPILTAFRTRRPLAEIHVNIFDTEHAVEETRSGASDLAIVVADSDPGGPGMVSEPIGEDELILISAPSGPPERDVIPVAELAELPFIEAPERIIRRQLADRQLRRIGITKRRVVMHLGHPEAMKRAAQDGAGVSLVFRAAAARELAAGELREIAVEGASFRVPIYLVQRKDKLFSTLHRELIEEIRRSLDPGAAAR